jgi:hypothetical protein
MQFTGIASATNSTAVTIAVGALPALPGYKDTVAGLSALGGNEIAQTCQFTAIYDSALNSGNGGFHIKSLDIGPYLVGSAGNSLLTNIVSAAASIGWPNIPVAGSSVSTIPVTGCSVGDCVLLGMPASVPTGIAFFGWVSTVGVVTIQASNMSGASLTPVAGTYRATAQRYTP